MTDVTIYTDGSARGNPDGPGGYGTVILVTDKNGQLHTKELSGGYARTTNNRMELMAAIVGLEALTRPCRVKLHSDSQYLVRAFNDHWVENWRKNNWMRGSGKKKEPVKNPELWKRLLAAMEPHEVTFVWVKGHAGDFYNERCDALATSAADQPGLPPDPGMA
ncbi:MAG: ribonuclease HI [Lachnospiraceae bacterium]